MNFTDEAVYIAEGEKHGAYIGIKRYAAVPLSPGMIENGAIADEAGLTELLEDRLAAGGFVRKDAVITVVSTLINSSEHILPYTKKKRELENMLRAELSNSLADGENVFDYEEPVAVSEDGAKKSRVSAFTAPVSLVSAYKKLLGSLKFKNSVFSVTKSCMNAYCAAAGDAVSDSIFVYADKKLMTLYITVAGGSLMARQRPAQQFEGASYSAELSAQVVRLMQFKQISVPGSSVSQVLLFGSEATEDNLHEIEETAGVHAGFMQLPGAIKATEDLDAAVYMWAALALYAGR